VFLGGPIIILFIAGGKWAYKKLSGRY